MVVKKERRERERELRQRPLADGKRACSTVPHEENQPVRIVAENRDERKKKKKRERKE